MDLSGVQLGARFSLATNRLKYCGPSDAEAVLLEAIVTGTGLDAARSALARFEALNPYLQVLADLHGRDPFDVDVVEAYWIGNELLDEVPREAFLRILKGLRRNGLPPRVAGRLAANIPDGALPHHMFHVAYVGVGAVTGKVATTLENMDRCRPSWGRVVRRDASRLRVERSALVLDDGRFALGPPTERSFEYDARILPDVAPGDTVALHWGWPVLRLSAGRVDRLEAYTRRSLDAAQEGLGRLGVL
ncbi:MAG TPA: DUF6390 family protein [Thermoplasmata archaeon]|nr:DUF6390 family protein [Thermoplasmata archaeon]